MKYLLVAVLALVLTFASACFSTVPTEPEPVDAEMNTALDMIPDLPYDLDCGKTMRDYFNVTFFDSERTAQAEFEWGTDMTPDEVRQYFAVKISLESFKPYECLVYPYFLAAMHSPTFTDDSIMMLVMWIEMGGEDVPNGPPPEMDC